MAVAIPGNGKVITNIVHTDYSGQATSTSATPADVSGFSATITPSNSNNKILVFVSVAFGGANDAYPYVLLKRNGTSIGVGTVGTGNQINPFLSGAITNISSSSPFRYQYASRYYLDAPNTTGAVTYQIALASPYNGIAGYINRQSDQTNNPYIHFPISCITLQEVSGY